MKLPYFENNSIRNPSPTRTYNSNVCRGDGSYYNQDGGDFTYNIGDCGDLWNGSKLKYNNSKPPHISNLRNILSDTISNLTKRNNLKKGESIELTLEIELMKTLQNTPTNSLVEVTIIQHNKPGELNRNSGAQSKILANKMPFQVENKSSESVSASQKRRNWFQRVITRQFQIESLNEKHTDTSQDDRWKMQGEPIHKNRNDFENEQRLARRNRFVTILPEEIPIDADFTKGYRKVSPHRKSLTTVAKKQKPRNIMTATRKDSLVKKLSDIFLPSKKAEKSKAVETALTELKNEVDNIKLKNVTNGKKKKRAPVHNLGKLVSNILVDVMESSESTVMKHELKGNSAPVKYKSFFEPVSYSNRKMHGETAKEMEINPSLRLATESQSDTCCIQPTHAISALKIKTSTSDSDCRAYNSRWFQEEYRNINQSTQAYTGKKTKIRENKRSRKSLKKNAKEYTKRHSNHQINTKKHRCSQHNRQTNSKKTLIEWNGQKLQVPKDIKGKIEKLIIKELQNLALKEGMECDVTPLPSTADSSSRIGKISSFICELDISDEPFKYATKRQKSLHNKLNFTNSLSTTNKKSRASSKHLRSNKTDSIKIADTYKTTQPEKRSRDSINRIHNLTSSSFDTNGKYEIKDDVEIKYINSNIKHWSAESNSIVFQNPEVNESLIKSKERTSKEVTALVSHNLADYKDRAFSSGFVRKIKSDDSTWNKFLSNGGELVATTEKRNISQNSLKKLVTVSSTKTMVQLNSSSSNKYESSIEIELDIKDLELILKEAKEKQKAEKVLISAKCKNDQNRHRQTVKFTGKNSPTYTNQLLLNACKRLERYTKTKNCH